MQKNDALTWLRQETKKYRSFVILLTVLEIFVSGLGVCYALVMKQMVDRTVAKDGQGFMMGMIGFSLLVLSQLIIRMRKNKFAAIKINATIDNVRFI